MKPRATRRPKRGTATVKPAGGAGPIPVSAYEEILSLLFTLVRDKYLNPEFNFKDEDEARAAAEDLSRLRDLILVWAPIPIAKKFLELLRIMGKETRGDPNRLYHDVCLDLRAAREHAGQLPRDARAVLRALNDLRITSNFTARSAGFMGA